MKHRTLNIEHRTLKLGAAWALIFCFGLSSRAELSVTVTPGYTFTASERPTTATLNLLGTPAINIYGTVDGSTGLTPGSVNGDLLADNLPDNVTIKWTTDSPRRLEVPDGGITTSEIHTGAVTTVVVKQDAFHYAAGAYSTNTYTVTLPNCTNYIEGMKVWFKPEATLDTNAGALNINGLGTRSLTSPGGTALNPGDIIVGQVVAAVYDGTNWQVQGLNQCLVSAGYEKNLVLQNTGTATNQMTVTADELVLKSATGRAICVTNVSLTCDINAAITNGLDAGVRAASTWYYLYVIDNGARTQVLFSASATAPTVPGGWVFKALVGAVYNNGSNHLTRTYQLGRTVYIAPVELFSQKAGLTGWAALVGTNVTQLQAAIPPMAKEVWGTAGVVNNELCAMAVAADNTGIGASVIAGYRFSATEFNGFEFAAPWRVALKTPQQFYVWMHNTDTKYVMNVSGYSW